VRESAFIEDTAADWTDSVILAEVYDQLTQVFGRGITKARQGYWLKQQTVLVTQGTAKYRVPNRCSLGGFERIEIAYDNTLAWVDLLEVDEKQALNYELQSGQQGTSVRFVMRGDQINLLPLPNGAVYALRLNYYLRPPRVIPSQAGGVVTAVNATARTITVNSVPNTITTAGVATAIASGSVAIDVISPFGWHEVQLVSETQTLAGSVFTCTGTGDMSTIKVGDVVRAEDQSDWPAIPDEYHRSVADCVALKICAIRRTPNPDVQADLDRALALFGDELKPRVQASAKAIVAPQLYRGARRGWLVKYP